MRTLYVAAGGGGDAVGALLARRALGDTDGRPPLVSTCAWERLRIDPVPGPRARTDFKGLGLVGAEPFEVLPDSDTVPGGRSVLPRLAETSRARIFLHDFEGGAVGLTAQLQRLASSLDVGKLVVVDVGGDIVARGPEPELRSPLADSLTLAAALGTNIPTSVVVLGPGADAELPECEVVGLMEDVGASMAGHITADDVRSLEPVLSWHPTEATALVAAGAEGLQGFVAMRRGQAPIPVTDRTANVWECSVPTHNDFPLARALRATVTLTEAESVMATAAVNEIDFERTIAAGLQNRSASNSFSKIIADLMAMGATHVTNRRLLEMVDPSTLTAVVETGPRRLWSVEELEGIDGRRISSRSCPP